MPSKIHSFFLPLVLLVSTTLTLAAPGISKEGGPPLALPIATPIHLHAYTNPSTSSDCNLDCRRIFCNSVSQFLESVTCTMHRPCLSLNLQFKIQEKCLNWRPEIHHGSGVGAIDGAATPAAGDVATTSKDVEDPDCMKPPPPPSAPQWVKAYVPASIAYEWLRKGDASTTHTMPTLKVEVNSKTEVVCVGVIRWMALLGVVLTLACAWHVKGRRDRQVTVNKWVGGKGEM